LNRQLSEHNIAFSVIVPTYNRLHLLKKTLESLFGQDFPDYEVIVVNDGGTDGTAEYIEGLAREGRITAITHPNAGLAATRRKGLSVARGEFVAFTDDDCIVPADWLARYHKAFTKTGAAGIGGATETGNRRNAYALVNDIMHNHFKRAFASARKAGASRGTPFLTGNNVAYRRAALEKAGGPDPRFRMGAEDRDLAYRVSATGGLVVYEPSIVVQHFNDSDFVRYVRQQFRYGIGSYLFYSESGRGGRKPGSASIGTYIGLLFAPFREAGFFRAIFLSLLIIVGQAAVTCGFVQQAMKGSK
jgi:cellulose synthase/poly-beta-1,6-N-acetylglucosamine synthase-like glycosyltransferase